MMELPAAAKGSETILVGRRRRGGARAGQQDSFRQGIFCSGREEYEGSGAVLREARRENSSFVDGHYHAGNERTGIGRRESRRGIRERACFICPVIRITFWRKAECWRQDCLSCKSRLRRGRLFKKCATYWTVLFTQNSARIRRLAHIIALHQILNRAGWSGKRQQSCRTPNHLFIVYPPSESSCRSPRIGERRPKFR